MSPFRDPEWQLHIPQKEYITIVLTHLYCISTCGARLGRRKLWPPARRFPLLNSRTAQAVSQRGLRPCKRYIVTESEA
jgi:methylphosphotriester-DNA--protein-cysteine methyltransferase